jgi:glucose-1-phosphate adenylyltransferase
VFNLYNNKWPIYTSYGPQPPAKVVEGVGAEPGRTFNSILSPGVVVTGGSVTESVLSPACYVDSGAQVSGSVLLPGVRVGAGAVVRNAILDKNVAVPPGAEIGVSEEHDRARGFVVQDGLTVLAKDQVVPA